MDKNQVMEPRFVQCINRTNMEVKIHWRLNGIARKQISFLTHNRYALKEYTSRELSQKRELGG